MARTFFDFRYIYINIWCIYLFFVQDLHSRKKMHKSKVLGSIPHNTKLVYFIIPYKMLLQATPFLNCIQNFFMVICFPLFGLEGLQLHVHDMRIDYSFSRSTLWESFHLVETIIQNAE